LYKRIASATFFGLTTGLLYQAVSSILAWETFTAGQIAVGAIWRAFAFAVISTIGAIIAELKLADPDIK
jgi:hypothetical protein